MNSMRYIYMYIYVYICIQFQTGIRLELWKLDVDLVLGTFDNS